MNLRGDRMNGIRTDLAVEGINTAEETEGVEISVKENGGVKITRVLISDGAGELAVGRSAGTYITVEAPRLEYSTEVYKQTCIAVARQLRGLAEISDDSVILVVGLGNERVTPDAVGPETVRRVMVTHHVKHSMPGYLDSGIRAVCAIAPGVLGTTGVETVEIVKGVAERVRPDIIIAVDALASRSLSRIGCTVQLSDTGITPGAGVGNRSDGLNSEALGVRVIAVGVPTVTDAYTAPADVLAGCGADPSYVSEHDSGELGRLVLTPKNIDLIVEKAAKTVANGINLALHKNMTFEFIESYVG